MNFASLQGLTIPEGVVTQIADASGAVLWALSGGDTVILEVEKITSDTYAGETTYTGEQFILLDIYPKTNSTVSVTYGGLTKTITDTSGEENPAAQMVFFGTFNGVSDSVATPASGELTIEGDYYAFGSRIFNIEKSTTGWALCIIAIKSFGNITKIPATAFGHAGDIEDYNPIVRLQQEITIPYGVTEIGHVAFAQTAITSIILPATLQSMGNTVFFNCSALKSITVLATTPPAPILGESDVLFGDNPPPDGCKIIVPAGCGDTYKAAVSWSTYADYITEAST